MASQQPTQPSRSAYVMVRTVEGRVAFSKPRKGVAIPTDRFVSVENTRWIRRLANYYGDITIQSSANPTEPTTAS